MSIAYYNDNDPICCEWLQNLIDTGLLPPGDVDDRSIADVTPDHLHKYTQCHFFAGVGGWPLALHLAGWPERERESGPEAAPVNRSVPQGKASQRKTTATSGPSFDASSSSAVLQRSLENKLRANLDVSGSPEYVLTWKHWDMELGPPICALRAAARRTSGKDYSGWPTPTQHDGHGPRSDKSAKKRGSRCLVREARLSGWATTTARDHKDGHEQPVPTNALLGRQVWLSADVMEKPAELVLNPAMSRWLMGYPQEPPTQGWDTCSPGWQSWGTIQKLLGEYSRKQDGTESAG